jgi:hypothetical protein
MLAHAPSLYQGVSWCKECLPAPVKLPIGAMVDDVAETDSTVRTAPCSEGAEARLADLVSRLDWVLSMSARLLIRPLVCLFGLWTNEAQVENGSTVFMRLGGTRMRHAQKEQKSRRVQRPKLKGSRRHVRYQKILLAGRVMCRGLQIMCPRVLYLFVHVKGIRSPPGSALSF